MVVFWKQVVARQHRVVVGVLASQTQRNTCKLTYVAVWLSQVISFYNMAIDIFIDVYYIYMYIM
jgi:hypothetical protein